MGFRNIPSMNNIYQDDPSSPTPKMTHNIMCVLGFILSLSVIILFFCFFKFSALASAISWLALFLIGIASLIISIIGLSTFNKNKQIGFGFGIAGLIISITDILVSIILMILVFIVGAGSILLGTALSISPGNKVPYTGPVKKIDNYEIRMEDTSDPYKAMLATWYWSGDPSDNLIEIPDTYEQLTLCAIGDTNSTSFEIKIDPAIQDYVTLSADTAENSQEFVSSVPEGTIIHFSEVDFTLKVGKNVNMVSIDDFPIYGIWNEDGSITYYHIALTYDCSSSNPYFYSTDGDLYKRGSDKPFQT